MKCLTVLMQLDIVPSAKVSALQWKLYQSCARASKGAKHPKLPHMPTEGNDKLYLADLPASQFASTLAQLENTLGVELTMEGAKAEVNQGVLGALCALTCSLYAPPNAVRPCHGCRSWLSAKPASGIFTDGPGSPCTHSSRGVGGSMGCCLVVCCLGSTCHLHSCHSKRAAPSANPAGGRPVSPTSH